MTKKRSKNVSFNWINLFTILLILVEFPRSETKVITEILKESTFKEEITDVSTTLCPNTISFTKNDEILVENKESIISTAQIEQAVPNVLTGENVKESTIETITKNNTIEYGSNESVLDKLKCSCEAEAESQGYDEARDVIVHEAFCEFNKLIRYILIAVQNVKTEFNLLTTFVVSEDVISFTEPIVNGVLSDIIGRRVIDFDQFVENTRNTTVLIKTLGKCIPLKEIEETVNRLKKIGKKLYQHAEEILNCLSMKYDETEVLKEMERKFVIVKGEMTSLFKSYLARSIDDTTDLLLTLGSWIELTFDNLKTYLEGNFHVLVKLTDELVNISSSVYERYKISELSDTVNDFILSSTESYDLFRKWKMDLTNWWKSSKINEIINMADETTLPTVNNEAVTSAIEKSVMIEITEDCVMLNEPLSATILQGSNDPVDKDSKSLTIDDYDQSKYVSSKTDGIIDDNLASYPSTVTFSSSPSSLSINNVAIGMESDEKTSFSNILPTATISEQLPTESISAIGMETDGKSTLSDVSRTRVIFEKLPAESSLSKTVETELTSNLESQTDKLGFPAIGMETDGKSTLSDVSRTRVIFEKLPAESSLSKILETELTSSLESEKNKPIFPAISTISEDKITELDLPVYSIPYVLSTPLQFGDFPSVIQIPIYDKNCEEGLSPFVSVDGNPPRNSVPIVGYPNNRDCLKIVYGYPRFNSMKPMSRKIVRVNPL